MRKNKKEIILVFVFLALVLGIGLSFFIQPRPEVARLARQPGCVDLMDADFLNMVYYYEGPWEDYPGRLYNPEDFEAGLVKEPPQQLAHEAYYTIDYATHRMQLQLTPGRIYAVSMRSADYSMRIFINGEEFDAVGNPGSTKEDTVPRVARRTYFFRPETGITTILVQSANFVHKEGAYAPNFYIGAASDIQAHDSHRLIIAFLVTGGLIMACFYHLGLYICNRGRSAVLLFSICCLLLVLMDNDLIPLFFPEYNWFVVFRLEYMIHFLTFAMLVRFLEALFPDLLHRLIARLYYALAGLYLLMTVILPTKVFSGLLIGFDGVSVFMIVYVLARLAIRMKRRTPESYLAFGGIFVICFFAVNDLLFMNEISFLGNIAGQSFTTPIGMLFFVVCYGLVLSLDYARAERAMLEAQKQVLWAEERYLTLVRQVDDNKRRFADPSSYGLSEREMGILWLLLDGKTRHEIAGALLLSAGTINTYCSRIYKKTNVSSLQELFLLFGVPEKKM